jgi:hypothetical protein
MTFASRRTTQPHPQQQAEPMRYVLVAVTGRDRADQRVHTEVFYSREAALKACDVLAPYTSIVATIIEDSHG